MQWKQLNELQNRFSNIISNKGDKMVAIDIDDVVWNTEEHWFVKGLFKLIFRYFDERLPAKEETILDILIYILCQNDHYKVSVLVSILMQNNHGRLDSKNLEIILREGIKDNGVIFDDEDISHMIIVMMNESTQFDSNSLKFSCMIKLLDEYPELYESLGTRYYVLA